MFTRVGANKMYLIVAFSHKSHKNAYGVRDGLMSNNPDKYGLNYQ